MAVGRTFHGNRLRLGGAFVVATAFATLALPGEAKAQATPGSAQCPIINRIVTCTGDVNTGVSVPAAGDRDGLTLENLTTNIVVTGRPGVRFTAGTPTTAIRLVDTDNSIRMTTSEGGFRDDVLGAVHLTALNNTTFSLLSDIDIFTVQTEVAGQITRLDPAGIVVRGSGGRFDIVNQGDVSMDLASDFNFPVVAPLLVDVFNADLVTVRNTGLLTSDGGGSGLAVTADNRRIEIVNDGRIAVTNAASFSGAGITLTHALFADYDDGYPRPGTPQITDFSFRVVNNGLIELPSAGYGITVDNHYILDCSPDDTPCIVIEPIGVQDGDIVNNGTIRAATGGIVLQTDGRRSVTNNGRIEWTSPAGDDFAPSGVEILQASIDPMLPVGAVLFENTAAGVIMLDSTASSRGIFPTGLFVDTGAPVIRNFGVIDVRGLQASGITVRLAGSAAETLSIDNSGRITAQGFNAEGVVIDRFIVDAAEAAADTRSTITSSGVIEGLGEGSLGLWLRTRAPDESGLEANGGVDIHLLATSVVRGGSANGAGIVFLAGERHTLRNLGLITAESGSAILGGTAAETIDNGGRIEGSVTLGAGADRMIARDGGVITGAIDGGDGADVLQLDVVNGSALFADRVRGPVSGFELLEKTGAGTLTLTEAVAPRAALLGGTLATNGDLGAMAVDAAAGTTLNGGGRLGDVVVADGATLSPGGLAPSTLTLASLTLGANSISRFDLGQAGTPGGANNDLVNIGGNLVLDGGVDVIARPGFGDGVYRLFNYGGGFTDNGLVVRPGPTADYQVQTTVSGQVNLVVANFVDLLFWDDGDSVADGTVDGGAGTWNAANTNWTNSGGTQNRSWATGFAVFQGTGGAVTVEGAQTVRGIQFTGTGYRLGAGTGGSIVLGDAATVVRVDPGASAELAVPLTGSGALVKRDLGTLILTGVNSYTGGTVIREGVLQASADTAFGAAAGRLTLDGGALRAGGSFTSARTLTAGPGGGTIDTQANSLTLSGLIGGTAGITKTGTGTLILSGGSAAYAGRFTLGTGTLRLDGTLGGTIEVGAGTTLAGTGIAGNLIVAGTLSPGNSIGTLSATNATFRAGSVFAVEITAAGAADRLNLTGTATIEGGTVAITALDPELNYTDGSTYIFLSAAGGRTGTFAALSESSAFLDFALGYTATTAFLTVDVIRTFPEVAQTFNQIQAATGLRALDRTTGSDSLAAYNAILLLDEAPALAAFDATSGEIYAVLMASALRRSEMVGAGLSARGHSSAEEGLGFWGGVDGHDGSVDGDGNGARFTNDGLGGNGGLDYRGRAWAVGIGGGWSDGDVALLGRASRAATDSWHIGAYASFGSGHEGFSATASAVRMSGEADVTRAIAFGTVARTASSRVDVETTSLALDLRYGLPAGGAWAFGPALSVGRSSVDLGRFAETGASSLGLSGTGSSDDWTSVAAGAFAALRSGRGSIDASLQYLHGGGRAVEAGLSLGGAPAQPFRVRAAVGGDDAVLLQLAGGYRIGGSWTIGGNLRAVAGSGEKSVAGAATVGLRF